MSNSKVTFSLIAAAGLVIFGAATSWYLASRNAEPVAPAQAEALLEQADLNMELLQNSLDERLSGLNSEEQERLDTPVGQALMRRCLEWEEFHSNHTSDVTRQNRDSACAEYRNYLASGVLPEDD